ncbi:MAG: type II/IV secretion system protein [Piscirickettsiaceae bacterium]|nr:type II/IV secretion system protein [Piscirickettsiaceae bacterium]
MTIAELIIQAIKTNETGKSSLNVLEETSGLAIEKLVAELAEFFSYQTIHFDEMLVSSPAFDLLSFSDAIQRDCVVISDDSASLTFVFSDVFDSNLMAWAVEKIALPFTSKLASRADITAYLAKQEESLRAVDSALSNVGSDGVNENLIEELSLHSIEMDDSSVVKLVRSTLYDALKADASDVHLETTPQGLAIKYRLDGVISQMGAVSEQGMAEQIVSRIKVMAELDITETRIPQDGRFRAVYRGREIDFRVSIMPSIHGEDVVIRVLDKQSLADHVGGLRLDYLGFDDNVMAVMRRHFLSPYGMVLVTGPTGSGKTTTLYAAISEINNGMDKIITIEDPVEYQLSGVLQIPVNEKKGLSFSLGLRSILRHDPDKIMVGEIRDGETAQIAVQSALTGHLVFTTVHANNVFDVIGRFLNMGVDPYSFVSALNIVIAQRLIRTVCSSCAELVAVDEALTNLAGVTPPEDAKPVHGKGCGVCRGTGYKGRRAVAEILCLDDELRELIARRAPISQIKEHARNQGTYLLREAALDLAWRGETTIEEVNRVTAMA